MEASAYARAGVQAVRQNPKLILIEIAWRWIFGAGALLLLWLGYRSMAAHLPVSQIDAEALRGASLRDSAAALYRIFSQPETWRVLLSVIRSLTLPMFLLWTTAAGVGRHLGLRAAGLAQSNLRRCVAYGALRFVAVLGAVLAWFLWAVLCSLLTLNGEGEGNWAAYLLLAVLVVPFVAALWGAVNWIFSIAPMPFSGDVASKGRLRGIIRQTVRERRLLFGISGWFGIPRLVSGLLLALAFVLCAALLPWQVGGVVFTVASLGYCAFADALYVARLMAFGLALSTPGPAAQDAASPR